MAINLYRVRTYSNYNTATRPAKDPVPVIFDSASDPAWGMHANPVAATPRRPRKARGRVAPDWSGQARFIGLRARPCFCQRPYNGGHACQACDCPLHAKGMQPERLRERFEIARSLGRSRSLAECRSAAAGTPLPHGSRDLPIRTLRSVAHYERCRRISKHSLRTAWRTPRHPEPRRSVRVAVWPGCDSRRC